MLIGAEVLVVSVARHAESHRRIVFHIFTERDIFARLEELFASLNMAHLDLRLAEIPASGEVTNKINSKDVVLGSLHLPEILSHVGRLVIIDADTLVLRALDALFDADLKGETLAAVTDHTIEHFLAYNKLELRHPQATQNAKDYFATVVGKTRGRYLNSGVLVVDTAKWVSEQVTKQCLSYLLHRAPSAFNDQDALNHVFRGRYSDLDPRWNAIAFVCRDGPEQESPSVPYQTVRRAWRKDPWIVHYAGPCKPWRPDDYPSDHRDIFFDIASRNTLTAGYKVETEAPSVVRRLLRRVGGLVSR